MNDLILIGASGVAYEIIDSIFRINDKNKQWNIVGVIDDDTQKHGLNFYRDVVVLGGKEKIKDYDLEKTKFIITFSSPSSFLKREGYISDLKELYPDIQFANIIDPAAAISPTAKIGEGNYFCRGVIIDALASVGSHCIILFNTLISRLSVVGDYNFISGYSVITGDKRVGSNVYIGIRSIVDSNLGSNILLGSGSIIKSDIENNSLVSIKVNNDIITTKSPRKLQLLLNATE